jgi:hypothetical protein
MRKAIRLTGRRQLAVSAFDFQFVELNGKSVASLAVADSEALKPFPPGAAIRVKLTENKRVAILDFGTILKPVSVVNTGASSFQAPSCQVRIVSRASESEGKLLGSTSTWTYNSDGGSEGILLFQAADTAPRLYRLEIRDEELPILYVDNRIPAASVWAKSDPLFTASVFPQVISEVFRRILTLAGKPEDGWMAAWTAWAETLVPGSAPPYGDAVEGPKWIDTLIDTFAGKHDLADKALLQLTTPK